MVVWARRTPENRQRTARTQTVRTQIPLLPQSHRLRIFAPRTSMDHHRQDSGFFGFFLALAAGPFLAPPPTVSHRRWLGEIWGGVSCSSEHPGQSPRGTPDRKQPPKVFSAPATVPG